MQNVFIIIYRVKPGDTLYSIEKKFNTVIKDIILINGLFCPILFVGQLLKIPIYSYYDENFDHEGKNIYSKRDCIPMRDNKLSQIKVNDTKVENRAKTRGCEETKIIDSTLCVYSPDGRVQVTFILKNGILYYEVIYSHKYIIKP